MRDRNICLLRWRSKGINRKTNCIKGRISYLLGENKDAISYLEKAKEHKQMLASYYLGLAYDANGDSDKAKKCIAEYIKSGVATSYDLYELGMQEMQDGNYKNALTYFNSGLELEKVPNKQNLMKSAIAAYEYSGDFDSAKKMMKEYLKAFVTPGFMTPMNILEELTNFASLALRIFGNIFAGEVLASLLVTLSHQAVYWYPFAFIGSMAWTAFSIFISCIQAYVFTMLSSIYIGKKINGEE